ncbi:MAG: hypothetical protein GEEBNDBF_00644 [bacterium]|nr:hypothetical protein [bacterium]
MPSLTSPPTDPELTAALECLLRVTRDGLKHGYFEITVQGELTTQKRRVLTIKAGKSHRYLISPDEFDR